MRCKVLVPFVKMDPANGFTSYTVEQVVDLEPQEANKMAAAGIVQIISEPVKETAELPAVETAEAPKVRRGKEKK